MLTQAQNLAATFAIFALSRSPSYRSKPKATFWKWQGHPGFLKAFGIFTKRALDPHLWDSAPQHPQGSRNSKDVLGRRQTPWRFKQKNNWLMVKSFRSNTFYSILFCIRHYHPVFLCHFTFWISPFGIWRHFPHPLVYLHEKPVLRCGFHLSSSCSSKTNSPSNS